MSSSPVSAPSARLPGWQERVAPYRRPSTSLAMLQLVTAVSALVGLEVAAFHALDAAPWLVPPLVLLAAGFTVRLFIIQHDCGHGSFLENPRLNDAIGTGIGVLMLTPYFAWRHAHAIHHASTGDLERRGTGDIPTLTVAEYRALSSLRRLGYRVVRNPLLLCFGGVFLVFIVAQRIPGTFGKEVVHDRREVMNIHLTTLFGFGLFAAIWLLFGWKMVAFVHLPVAVFACAAGIFLFYVQHQLERPYWKRRPDWDYVSASLQGSSYLDLPAPLRFFSGNIGYHHIHHLAPKVPNYRLKACFDDNPCFQDVTKLGVLDSLRTLSLKLYDEQRERMVRFRDAES
jgi:omega-6 fatty acid desaturase (delta-12 desaturase)